MQHEDRERGGRVEEAEHLVGGQLCGAEGDLVEDAAAARHGDNAGGGQREVLDGGEAEVSQGA